MINKSIQNLKQSELLHGNKYSLIVINIIARFVINAGGGVTNEDPVLLF